MGEIDVLANASSITLNKPWKDFAKDKKALTLLEQNVFYAYMRKCRWFAGKARMIKFLKVQQLLTIPIDGDLAYYIIVHVGYTYGDEEKYAITGFFPAG